MEVEMNVNLVKKSKQTGAIWGIILVLALVGFEVFNFSTTRFALYDLWGSLGIAGISYATIFAIVFCAIDFGGIARIFTPEQGNDEPRGVGYLFGAWLFATAFNAVLTWWGVRVAMINHGDTSTFIPLFVAVMVWLTRVLIIGTFSLSGNRLFHQMHIQHAPRR